MRSQLPSAFRTGERNLNFKRQLGHPWQQDRDQWRRLLCDKDPSAVIWVLLSRRARIGRGRGFHSHSHLLPLLALTHILGDAPDQSCVLRVGGDHGL